MAGLHRIVRRLGMLIVVIVATIGPAAGDTGDGDPALRHEFDALFRRMLREPDNLDVAFRYAEVATQLGDYEAAIAALERMLFFQPDLPRVQLELGVLYLRLGSYEAARGYLERARAAPDVPPEVAATIDRYLAEIARLESRHQFLATLFLGAQYQSNANAGPASPLVRAALIPGAVAIDASLADRFTKKSDFNGFITGTAVYSYDLRTQDRDTIEVTGTAFASKYVSQKQVDLGFVELTAGPRLRFAAAPGLSFRPYLLGNDVYLGRKPFFLTYGAGAEIAEELGALALRLTYEHREKNYRSNTEHPGTRELTGHDDIVAFYGAYALTPDQAIIVGLSFVGERTRNSPGFMTSANSYEEYGGLAGYQVSYDAPFGLGSLPWLSAVAVGRYYMRYAAPDPFIDPGVARADRRWRWTLAQTIPIAPDLAIVLQFERDVVSSNLPNFAYTNTQVVIGPQLRF